MTDTDPLHWTPPAGGQTAALRAAGLRTQDLRDAGYAWTRRQRWEARPTEAAAAILARLSGQATAQVVDRPAEERPAEPQDRPRAQAQERAALALARDQGRALALAERLDRDAEAGERPRDLGTPKRMSQGMHARLEAGRSRRASALLRAWAANPGPMPGWKPSKADALLAVRRETTQAPNGWHSHQVETDAPYRTDDQTALALRRAYPESMGVTVETPRAKIERLEAAIRFSPIDGFFPTPPSLIARMIELARINPGDLALEPSAGCGHLAEAMARAGASVHCCEVNGKLREILVARGLELVADDCMAFASALSGPTYDRILLNPPFERGQDRDHIRRMHDLLKTGGRLVAVCSTGPFHRNATADQAFRDWLDQVGADVEDVEPGAFSGPDAFRKTGVSVKLITIDK